MTWSRDCVPRPGSRSLRTGLGMGHLLDALSEAYDALGFPQATGIKRCSGSRAASADMPGGRAAHASCLQPAAEHLYQGRKASALSVVASSPFGGFSSWMPARTTPPRRVGATRSAALPVVMATMLRSTDFGDVHVHRHVHQVLNYLQEKGTPWSAAPIDR